jgi:hypothetical protein
MLSAVGVSPVAASVAAAWVLEVAGAIWAASSSALPDALSFGGVM